MVTASLTRLIENVLQCSRLSHHSIYDGSGNFIIPDMDIISGLEVNELVVNEFGYNEGEKTIYARIGDNDLRELQTTITSKITVGTGSGTYSFMSFDMDALGINSISFDINALASSTDGYFLNSYSKPYVVLGATISSGAPATASMLIGNVGKAERRYPTNNMGIDISVTGTKIVLSLITDDKAGTWKIKTIMNTLFNDVSKYSQFSATTKSFDTGTSDGTFSYS